MNNFFSDRYEKILIRMKSVRGFSLWNAEPLPKEIENTTHSAFSPEQVRHIDPRFVWFFWGIWAVVVFLSYALFQLTNILYLIITGFIVALALERFIQFWQQLWCSRGFALWLSYTILILFMLSGMIIMIPFIVTQLASLMQIAFDAIQSFQIQIQEQWLLTVIQSSSLPDILKTWFATQAVDGWWISLIQSVLTENITQVVAVGGESLKSAWTIAVGLVDSVFNTLFQIVLVITVAVFFSLERLSVFLFIAKLTKHPKKTYETLQQLSSQLGHWLEGQLLLCCIIGSCVAVGLRIMSRFGLDLPNKFSLALIAWLTEFLPYIWPLLWSIPALLVALLWFWWKWVLVTALLYWWIQTAENNVIVPAVMSQKLWVSPLVIFLCMLLWASLFGFLWVLLAVPLAVIVSILVGLAKNKWKEKNL